MAMLSMSNTCLNVHVHMRNTILSGIHNFHQSRIYFWNGRSRIHPRLGGSEDLRKGSWGFLFWHSALRRGATRSVDLSYQNDGLGWVGGQLASMCHFSDAAQDKSSGNPPCIMEAHYTHSDDYIIVIWLKIEVLSRAWNPHAHIHSVTHSLHKNRMESLQ